MLGRSHCLLGITSTFWEVNVSCTRIQHGDHNQSVFTIIWGIVKIVKILVRFISYENCWCDHQLFFFTRYYWSYLLILADKTEKYWCVNIFFIGLKPNFLAFLPVRQKKWNFHKNYLKKLLFSQLYWWKHYQVNVGGFNIWFFIPFFEFFLPKYLCPKRLCQNRNTW